ncbi:PRC-barrel domain-containing protein [Chitiniphilus shinanonensis]|uniref:PRC-barrel domain-containing protein n=1 Tax=Chitiniphilus shinanonensis TaxID=553088 RepID=UPI003068CC40
MSTWNLNSGIVYDSESHTDDPAPARVIPPADKIAAVETSPGSPAVAETGSGPGACLAAVDELQCYALTDTANQALGKVHSFIVDLHQGRMAYVVVALEGAPSGQLAAVPWHALAHAPHERRFVLNSAQVDPAKAPSFDAAAWPDMSQSDWARTLHDFYQARPYWQ